MTSLSPVKSTVRQVQDHVGCSIAGSPTTLVAWWSEILRAFNPQITAQAADGCSRRTFWLICPRCKCTLHAAPGQKRPFHSQCSSGTLVRGTARVMRPIQEVLKRSLAHRKDAKALL